MSEIISPAAVIEGRTPLPNQRLKRQIYLPERLKDYGVKTHFVIAHDPRAYDASGRIRGLHLDPGQYAWRLRDITWEDLQIYRETGDPPAYPVGCGYNSFVARSELATRERVARVLQELNLAQYAVETHNASDLHDWPEDEFVFVKPNQITDINDVRIDPGDRAHYIPTAKLSATLAELQFTGGAVLQRPQQLMPADILVDHLGLAPDVLDPSVNYFHALRVLSPMWLPAYQPPAIELRLTDPRDIGTPFATKLQLLEPELVFRQFPDLALLHTLLHAAFIPRFSEDSYLTFDYIVNDNGLAKLLNTLRRALTPNLEGQPPEVQHLANETADVEVRRLAEVAISLV